MFAINKLNFTNKYTFFCYKRGMIMKDHYTSKEKAWRWIKFGVLPAFIPLILAIIYDIYLEFTFAQIISRHFLDLILIVFTIAVSIIGSAMDLNNNVDNKVKEKYAYTSIILCIICFAFYSFLYNKDDGNMIFMTILRISFCLTTFKIIRNGFKLESEEPKNKN